MNVGSQVNISSSMQLLSNNFQFLNTVESVVLAAVGE